MREPRYIIERIKIQDVKDLCAKYHGYGGAGNAMTYAYGVIEDGRVVAAYAWAPPTLSTGRSVCPEAPQGVLALSRMVAVPRDERRLKHISKPLRHQMKHLIDRTRWPVLLTYSDQGQGHTGHVYKCSGWETTGESKRPFFTNDEGQRVSSYSNGGYRGNTLVRGGTTTITRWEHWVCPRGYADAWMVIHGWRREIVEGKFWRSGSQAYTWVRGTK